MKYISKVLLIFMIMLFPVSIKAYEITCDKELVDYDANFFCYINGNSNINYEELSGNITSTDDLITCTPTAFSSGLNIKATDKNFSYFGIPTDNKLVTFSCKLNKKLSNITKTQVKIENFKYQIVDSNLMSGNEILSTDFINANKYAEKDESDNLPRNTSNPNSLLKDIKDDNLNLIFSRFITIYNQEVLYEVDKLNLNIIPNNENATIKIIGNNIENNTNLNVGKNTINIFVTSPDGVVTTCYTLNVTRLPRGEEIYYPEKDATLYSLAVSGYSLSFDKNVFEYQIHLPSDISKIDVNAVPTYDEAKVNISSTDNLKNGSIVKLTVISKDKSSTLEYKIKITKDAPKANYSKYIIFGLVTMTLIALVIVFIKTSQNKKIVNSQIPNIAEANISNLQNNDATITNNNQSNVSNNIQNQPDLTKNYKNNS